MKRIQVAAAILLFSIEAVAVVDYSNVTGSLGVIKAFQALHTGNINSLVEALGQRPSPINEGFSLQTSQGEVRLRLIHVAPLAKSEQMLNVLVAAGARVSATDSLGRSAVHYLSGAVPEVGQHFNFHPSTDGWWASQMLVILHGAGISLEAVDNKGRQGMHYAAAMGAKSLLQTLIHLGAPLDPLDLQSKTPVHLAASQLHLDTVDFLRSRGAKTEVNFYDYLMGGKNRALGLLYDHPVGAALAVASIFAINFVPRWCSSLMSRTDSPRASPNRGGGGGQGSAPLPRQLQRQPQQPQQQQQQQPPPQPSEVSKNNSPNESPAGTPRGDVSPRDNGGDSPKKSSGLAAAGGGGGLAAAAVLHKVSQNGKQEAAASAPKATAKTINRQLRDAIERLNGARDGNNAAEAIAALDDAEKLLEALKGNQLEPADLEERRHLLAAIHGINIKLKDNGVRGRADVVYEKYKGKQAKRR